MTFREKVIKILAEELEEKDKSGLVKHLKEKVGSELTKDLTKQFEQSFNKYLHLKGETYIKPLIVSSCKEMIALEQHKDNEEWIRKVIKEEIEKINNESN